MTVVFDSVANLGQTDSPLSGNLVLGGSATALLVAVAGFGVSNFTGTGYQYTDLTTQTVTVGTTPLTLLGIVSNGGGSLALGGTGWTELWGLINPPTGSQTITVTEIINQAGAAPIALNATAISYTGVSQFGTAVTNSGSGSLGGPTNGAVVSKTGDIVIEAVSAYSLSLNVASFSNPSGTLRSNQPNPPVSKEMSLLVQDAPGAPRVTETCTISITEGRGWGVVSLDIVAGVQQTNTASRSITASASAAGTVSGAIHTSGAARSATMTAAAAGVVQALGPPLRYVGRAPDLPGTIATAAYAQADATAFLVTPAFVTQQTTQATANLVNQTWINQQVANYSTQSQVNTTLGAYLPTSALGSTVAQLDSNGLIPGGVLPTITTNSLAVSYDVYSDAGAIFLPAGVTFVTTTSNIGELEIASITIPDPGYAWLPYAIAYVQGFSGATPSGSRLFGNGNVGYITVTPQGQTTPIYASGLCTADTLPNIYQVTPAANSVGSITPQIVPSIVGGLTLQLSACNFTGSDYTYSGSGLVFFVVVLPALGGS